VRCERACCTGKHAEPGDCDPCPFEVCGDDGRFLYTLFQWAAREHEEAKTKRTRWALDDKVFQVLDAYGVTDKPLALRLLGMACAILNGRRG
jgi:hypothetical protein